ncbi:MAG: TraR/DksA C4-type zinc finger protein [Nitrospirae bacterium]|nr:TraR/DksA C4-type zinc finger protein [Nitrospirota bacterium]
MSTKTERRRHDALRTMLHDMRERAVQDIEAQMGRRLNEASRHTIDAAMDLADWAAMDLEDDVDLTLLQLRYTRYKEIADAFRRLETDTYGVCEQCRAEIPLERLEVEPFARFCVSCQERLEALERVDREEQRFKTAHTPARG